MSNAYQVAFLGHYTKATIISSSGRRVVDGGAFNYGSHVAAAMGLEALAITRLAEKDSRVIQELESLGVDVSVKWTPQSTGLNLVYPSDNPDERVIYINSWAGAFNIEEVNPIEAEIIVVGASLREEVPAEIIKILAKKESVLAADVQSFIRINDNGKLVTSSWPEKKEVLSFIDVLKTDAVEAAYLTGKEDIKEAALLIHSMGPREVVITHRDGVLVWAEEKFYEASFYPRELIGRSGRGDTCLASYMCKRLHHSPAESTIWAAALTSIKMEAEGPFRRPISDVEELILRKYQ